MPSDTDTPSAVATGSRNGRCVSHCSTCAMRHFCMPQGLSALDTERLEQVIEMAVPVVRGDILFRPGDRFDALYAVRSGALKTTVINANGREQVTGLHLSGDPLGFDAFGESRHASNAIALEDSSVCVIPRKLFERTCRENPSIHRRLLQLMGEELVRRSAQMLLLGALPADERVATLLLDLSARLTRRGLAGTEFNLRLTRDEIGSLLGITLETVSRILSRLQAKNLIEIKGRIVTIRNAAALAAM